jgi:hypothetical protein
VGCGWQFPEARASRQVVRALARRRRRRRSARRSLLVVVVVAVNHLRDQVGNIGRKFCLTQPPLGPGRRWDGLEVVTCGHRQYDLQCVHCALACVWCCNKHRTYTGRLAGPRPRPSQEKTKDGLNKPPLEEVNGITT